MPTPSDAVRSRQLDKIEGGLDAHEQEQRLLYATLRAVDWMESNLDDLEADGFYENAATPLQQADDLFYSFVSGEDMASDWPPHVMKPSERGVWELRTPDLRFFGWFWRKGVFVISAVNSASQCKQFSLYAGYRDQCVRDRESFDFDPPPYINGELSDVL